MGAALGESSVVFFSDVGSIPTASTSLREGWCARSPQLVHLRLGTAAALLTALQVKRKPATVVFKVILAPSEDDRYTVLVPSLPGCITEGDTVEQALQNAREAIELYLEPVSNLYISPQSW